MSIIFTNHAQERMHLRKLAQSDIEKTLAKPDRTLPGKKPGTIKFIREINGRNHQVVAKKLENQKDWLVLSVWVRGEEDFNWVEWIVILPFRVIRWVFKKIF
jgi:hypothetical protein